MKRKKKLKLEAPEETPAPGGQVNARTGFQTRAWPDDCGACGARMAFDLTRANPLRRCPCGVTVTAAQALAGRFTPAPLRLKKAA